MKEILISLAWIEEILPPELMPAPKYRGVAYYRDMTLVLILVERGESTYEYKGATYSFDLWKGCIFPIEQKKQNAFFLKYSFLENHPANKNWLFISAESENFEEEVKLMIREIAKCNPLLGIEMKVDRPARIKKVGTKPKNDKKRENAFLLSMAQRGKSK